MCKLKKFYAIFLLFTIFALPARAENIFAITAADANGNAYSGTAFYKAGDLWVNEQLLRFAGVQLSDALNGKGFYVTVNDADSLLEVPALRKLGGAALKLYFPAVTEQNVKYFNISGLERLTGCFVQNSFGAPQIAFMPKETAAFAKKNDKTLPVPFVLTWEHVTKFNPELSKEPVINGLDVLAPTWFNLADATGTLANRASSSYVEEAHRRGCKVWAMVTNSFNKQLTKDFLKNAYARQKFIAQLLAFSKLYGLDGINIDFENVDLADRNAFTQLLTELAPCLKEEGLVFSIAVNKPGSTASAKSHDRRSMARLADFIMVMTYDQHWRTSPVAGSVADLAWTRSVLVKTLEEVPAQKLMLGIPFYSRRWICTPLAGGKEKVSSQTLTMAQSDELIRKHNLTPVWLENKGQHYFEFSQNGKKIKVWAEDASSIQKRAELVKEFGLAGAACWRKGHEQPYAWNAIFNTLR